jgi:flavorubredoxin
MTVVWMISSADVAPGDASCREPWHHPSCVMVQTGVARSGDPTGREDAMGTRIDEIADGIFRLSTYFPEVVPPAGFTINQFLVLADEPLLFHCGLRAMFPSSLAAVAKLLPVERLRWITFGHFEADECGSMNDWLAVAPQAQVAHGAIACDLSLVDQAARPPRVLADGEVLDLGGKRVRYLDTPHVPHGWDAGVVHEETTATLLCGDLFAQVGDGPAVTAADIVEAATEGEEMFRFTSLGPTTTPTVRRLADLAPRTLALMHGPSFAGDGAGALRTLAGWYDERLRRALA